MSLVSVLPSVRTPVHKLSCPLCNLNSVWKTDDTSQLSRRGHDDVSHTKVRALALIFLVICPLMLFMHIRVRSVP